MADASFSSKNLSIYNFKGGNISEEETGNKRIPNKENNVSLLNLTDIDSSSQIVKGSRERLHMV